MSKLDKGTMLLCCRVLVHDGCRHPSVSLAFSIMPSGSLRSAPRVLRFTWIFLETTQSLRVTNEFDDPIFTSNLFGCKICNLYEHSENIGDDLRRFPSFLPIYLSISHTTLLSLRL